eukprot:CAMPEP_0115331414 /NCGR_PEP_ID=MMETSP0270-20121206/86304_1 /TAXON_ID=71861 /ORGANISM="Scrippsiella trochoidea, Strain CCMP3099" /LENGTH=80 /DNA_ID=CAMNT_0002752207 /DNA_START=245 /DNA_END=483 /DNA_ORIENTATION=-
MSAEDATVGSSARDGWLNGGAASVAGGSVTTADSACSPAGTSARSCAVCKHSTGAVGGCAFIAESSVLASVRESTLTDTS